MRKDSPELVFGQPEGEDIRVHGIVGVLVSREPHLVDVIGPPYSSLLDSKKKLKAASLYRGIVSITHPEYMRVIGRE